MMLTPERLAELRAIAEKATHGPWVPDEVYILGPVEKYVHREDFIDTGRRVVLAVTDVDECNWPYFAAIDPPTVLALIAAAERTAVLEAACKAMAEWGDREDDRSVSFDERAELCKEAFALVHAALATEPI